MVMLPLQFNFLKLLLNRYNHCRPSFQDTTEAAAPDRNSSRQKVLIKDPRDTHLILNNWRMRVRSIKHTSEIEGRQANTPDEHDRYRRPERIASAPKTEEIRDGYRG
jgi:hypothetical protein